MDPGQEWQQRGVSEEEEIADVEEEEATGETRDIMMTEIEIATTTMNETEGGALAMNDQSDPAQLGKVRRVDHCSAGDCSRTEGVHIVLARATERNLIFSDQLFSRRNDKNKQTVDGDTERGWPGG